MSNEQFIGWCWQLLAGASVTVELTLISLPLGMVLGLAIALAKQSRSRLLRMVAELFTTVFRGLPELMTLLILYYGLQMLLQRGGELGWMIDVQIPPFAAGAVALTLVAAAYSSENFLTALRCLDRGQLEAASSFGMRRHQVFMRVSIPQLLRTSLPALGNNCMNILKDTSLVSIIALEDLMRKSYLAAGNTKEPIVFFLLACAIYLVLSGVLLLLFACAERYYNRGVVRYV